MVSSNRLPPDERPSASNTQQGQGHAYAVLQVVNGQVIGSEPMKVDKPAVDHDGGTWFIERWENNRPTTVPACCISHAIAYGQSDQSTVCADYYHGWRLFGRTVIKSRAVITTMQCRLPKDKSFGLWASFLQEEGRVEREPRAHWSSRDEARKGHVVTCRMYVPFIQRLLFCRRHLVDKR